MHILSIDHHLVCQLILPKNSHRQKQFSKLEIENQSYQNPLTIIITTAKFLEKSSKSHAQKSHDP